MTFFFGSSLFIFMQQFAVWSKHEEDLYLKPVQHPKGLEPQSSLRVYSLSLQIKLNLDVCHSFDLSPIVVLCNPSGMFHKD